MTSFLNITVRFLQPYSHGRGDGGEPEWPPSPLRVFQALVNAAAARWNERMRLEYATPALTWLAKQPAPAIVAAVGVASDSKYRLYVPDNVADKVAKSWSGGRDGSIAEYRTEKDVRPTNLNGEAVHYLYPLADSDSEFAKHRETLITAARSITHLGWGVDMVAGDASVITEEAAAQLAGERWRPTADGSGTSLRVAQAGTLEALTKKHTEFLNRLDGSNFKPVSPLTAFDTVGYRRATDPVCRPRIAFRIASVDPDEHPSFDTPRRCRDVAAWVRHVTGVVCDASGGWPFGRTDGFVHGHTENGDRLTGPDAGQRFMYLPLPSIERRGDSGEYVGAIRRVLIAAPPGFQDRIDWIARRLPGQELVWDGTVIGLLQDLSASDWVCRRYTESSCVWSTVTPVVWPGHDDHDARKAERILRKAFIDAGLSRELVDGIVELEWRNVGFRAGLDLASNYARPDQLHGRMYHVRVRFPEPVSGPLAVGAGRFRGLGLFATETAGR